MEIFSNFSKLSGWYRLWVVASVIWLLASLIISDPWSHSGTDILGGGTYTANNWNGFLKTGITPLVIFWGVLWITRGFKKR